MDLIKILKKEQPQIIETTSGLKAAFWCIKNYQKKYGYISAPLGSINVRLKIDSQFAEIPPGAAHFLEHMIFAKGDNENVFDDFAALGAYLNAYTGYQSTNYFFSTPKYPFECLQLLLDFVQELHINTSGIEKERSVILQEIAMYRDNPTSRAIYNLLENMYFAHPVAKDIAGSFASVKQLDKTILTQLYNCFYHPENLFLILIGDFDQEQAKAILAENQSKKAFNSASQIENLAVDEPAHIKQDWAEMEMSISQPLLQLGYKINHHPQKGYDLLKRDTIYSMLLEIIFGTGSKGFYDLYDNGLIDDNFSYGFSGHKSFAHVIIGGNTDFPEKLKIKIIEMIKQQKRKGFAVSDLERLKRKYWGSFVAGLNSLELLATQFVKDYRQNISLCDHFLVLEEITVSDLNQALNDNLKTDSISVSLIKPA